MFPWNVAILSAIIMLALEYLVLIRVYDKVSNSDFKVLISPPLLLILAQYITYWIQDKDNSERKTFNPFLLVFVFLILKFPLSYYNHDVIPGIPLVERLAILAAEAISATIIAEGIIVLIQKSK